jgi:sirohydrochlorin ferrochelatase
MRKQKANRMPVSDHPNLLAVSRGTSSREGRVAMSALLEAVTRALPEVAVKSGFVDLQVPKLADLVGSVSPEQSAVLVPLLLSEGYEANAEIADTVEGASSGNLMLARAIGPDDRLVTVLRERLVQVGATRRDRIVLAGLGSGDPKAVADCRDMARRLGRMLGVPVAVGFVAASEPTVSDAVRVASAEVASIVRTARAGGPGTRPPRVIVSSYVLTPGYYYDLLRVSGADIITPPLMTPTGPTPQALVDLVAERYHQAAASLVQA